MGTPLAHMFSLGDSVEYIFTAETSTPDSNPDPVHGEYLKTISVANTVGSYTASIENYGIEVINNSNWGLSLKVY